MVDISGRNLRRLQRRGGEHEDKEASEAEARPVVAPRLFVTSQKSSWNLEATNAGNEPNTFLRVLDGTIRLLERIGSKQNAKVNSFKVVALYGAIEGAVKMAVNVNGKPGVKEIKGFSHVRKLFKQ